MVYKRGAAEWIVAFFCLPFCAATIHQSFVCRFLVLPYCCTTSKTAMNVLFAAVVLTLSHLHLVSGLSVRHRRDSASSAKFVSAAVARGADSDSYDMGESSPSGSQSYDMLDRNMVIACTNRHNCEMICAKAKTAKYASKSAFLDALVRSIGEDALTDAHKLGIQFGRRKSCDKCALVYSNCDNQLYGIARQQLFSWRSTPDDVISLPKSSNTL